ncbi:hypothetical protein PTKIN_Ptkin16aG0044600 [Pterospermum kingtungense]
MQSTSSGLESDIFHYTILIDGLCQVGQLKVTRELFCALTVKGLHPNAYPYNIMMKALCKEGLLDEAYELFRKIEADGCMRNSCSFNTMIRGFLHNNDKVRAIQILREMVEEGFSADFSTAIMVVDLLFHDSTGEFFHALVQNSEDYQSVNMVFPVNIGSIDSVKTCNL